MLSRRILVSFQVISDSSTLEKQRQEIMAPRASSFLYPQDGQSDAQAAGPDTHP